MDLLRHLPPKTGMAFVIVQHLDPHHGSRLPNLLGKATSMPVAEITGTITPQPNAVYVQPPNKCVIAKNGKLTLVTRTERLNVGIDHFFESLAEECGSRGIGIVLSGTGSDGTAGLRAIKAAGGLTFAQSEESAKFDAMPRSAIRSGFVDVVLRAGRHRARNPADCRPSISAATSHRRGGSRKRGLSPSGRSGAGFPVAEKADGCRLQRLQGNYADSTDTPANGAASDRYAKALRPVLARQ